MRKSRRILTAALVAFMGLSAFAGFLACGDDKVKIPSGDGKPSITFVPAADENCGKDGHIGYYTDGEKYFSDEAGEHELDWEQDILIPATGLHTAATAWQTQNGKHYHNCSVCGNKIESTEADCTPAVAWQKGNGKHWHNCSVCDTKIASTEADHDFDWVVDDNPTETQPGKKHEECKDCGETRNLDTEIPALGDIIEHPYKEPTCGEDGNEHYWEKDGKAYADAECTQEFDGDPIIPATGEHQEETEWQTENGKHWKNCSVCENKIDSTEADCTPEEEWIPGDTTHWHNCEECGVKMEDTVSAHEAATVWQLGEETHWHNCKDCDVKLGNTEKPHVFKWVIDVDSTDTETGLQHEECEDCGARRSEDTEIPKKGTIIPHEYKEPTCGEPGNEAYWEKDGVKYKDAECTEEYDGDPTIPPTEEHTEGDEWITGNGMHWKTCTVCHRQIESTLGAHQAKDEWQTENGKHWHNCEECGEKIDSSEADCTEEDEWQIDEEGDKHYHNCSVCGQKMEDTLDDHHYTDTVVDPTCTEGGYTEHKCEECGKTYTDGEVEATGHSYEAEWEWTKGEDGTYTATVTFVCSECEDTHELTAENVRVRIDEETGDKIYETDPVEFENQQYPGYYVVRLVDITLGISAVQQNFYAGTEFNYDNLVVTAVYNDESTEVVTPDSVSTPNMERENNNNDRTVTVTYKGMTATYTIHIISAGLYNGSELTMNAADTVVKDCHSQTDEHGDFVGGINVGSTLTFMFGSSVADTVALRIYGNGNGVGYFDVNISYDNDGETVSTTERVTLDTTGGGNWWEKWKEPFFICYLKVEQGKKYTVVFTAAGEGIEANIDYLKIAPANLPTYNGEDSLRLQGDKAEINGGEWQPGTADGIIGNIGEGSSFSFAFMSEYDGPVSLLVTLAGGIHKGDYNPVNNAKIRIYVNGKEVVVGGQEVKSNGVLSWDTFAYDIELEAGLNVIEFKVIVGDVTINTGDGEQAVFFNFSNIAIVPVLVYSGEEMTIGGDNAVTSGCSYEPSNGIIGGISSGNGSSFTFNIFAEQACSVDLTLNISGGAVPNDSWSEFQSAGTLEVYINGVSAGTFEVGTGEWEKYTDIFARTVDLSEGKNSIEFRATDGWFNFMYLTISPATT